MKMNKAISGLVLAAVATAALAAVTFDPATGKGFVGKGDVQLAFGWNNAELQKNASGVSFAYNNTTTYEADCVWYTGPEARRKRHVKDITTVIGVNSTIAYDARQRNQITGFNLSGLQSTGTADGTPPVEGEECKGGSEDAVDNLPVTGTWQNVTSYTTGDGLTVSTSKPSSMGPVKLNWPPVL